MKTRTKKLLEENKQLRERLEAERVKNRAWVEHSRKMFREMEALLVGT